MGWSGHSLEANQEQYGTINSYMGHDGLDGQADFVLYHAVVDNVFVSGNEDYQHLDFWTNRSQDQYLEGSIMVPYVGSHDVPRITSRADSGTSDAYNQWLENGLPGQPGDQSAYNSTLQAYGWLLTTLVRHSCIMVTSMENLVEQTPITVICIESNLSGVIMNLNCLKK